MNWSTSLRSTLGRNLVNQAVAGYTASTVLFYPELNATMFSGGAVGDQAGFNLNIGSFAIGNTAITTATRGAQWQSRENPTIQIEDTLTWLKGSHSYTFGGSFTHVGLWDARQTVVPTVNFGLATGDPALGLFTNANFPGASNAQLTSAQNLYAVLTGRISSINASVFLDENKNTYGYLEPVVQRGQLHELDFWRRTPGGCAGT